MSTKSNIQWCDGTCNPFMGCGGCELWPKNGAIRKIVLDELARQFPDGDKATFTSIVNKVLQDYGTAKLYHYRDEYIHCIDRAVLNVLPNGTVARSVRGVYESQFKCYAAKMTDMRDGHAGFPRSFDVPEIFGNRMATMAKEKSLLGQDRDEKPWLNGCPRLIFVSDMGDALSEEITFDDLQREITDVATSANGKRHVWLWLTKRPQRMVEFDAWLKENGIDWPDNLAAMTSITTKGSAKRIDSLRAVRAKIKGLSVEPLWEAVTLDLTGIDWVIVGGESGARDNAAPFHLEWARSLRDQCKKYGASFFMKQLGSNVRNGEQPHKYRDQHGGDWNEWPWDLRIREVPAAFREVIPITSTATVAR